MVANIGVAGDSIVLLGALQTWVSGLAWPRVILADWNIEPEGFYFGQAGGVSSGPTLEPDARQAGA
eukprot:2501292-Pyramimonas_sp.AAC.1